MALPPMVRLGMGSGMETMDPAQVEDMRKFLPNAVKTLRACLQCRLIMSREQFFQMGCPECEDSLHMREDENRVLACTTNNFQGFFSMIRPGPFASRFSGLEHRKPGCYALTVQGEIPEHILHEARLEKQDLEDFVIGRSDAGDGPADAGADIGDGAESDDGLGLSDDEPAALAATAHTPLGAPPAAAHTPLGAPPAAAHTPLGAPPAAHTPLGAPPAAAHTPLGAPPAAHTPLGAPPAARTPLGAPPAAHTPLGAPPAARTPLAAPGTPQAFGGILDLDDDDDDLEALAKRPRTTSENAPILEPEQDREFA